VLTSGPSPGMLGELGQEQRCDIAGVVDATQVADVFHQWKTNGVSAWKIPLLAQVLAGALIAGRIRALGFPAPGTYKEYARLSSIKEDDGVPSADEMIRKLVEGQEAVVRTARSIFPVVNDANDQSTADLLTQRMNVHEKTGWMLRSLLA